MAWFFFFAYFFLFISQQKRKSKKYFEIKKVWKCPFLSLYLRGKDFLLHFQTRKYIYKSKVFTPEKNQKKEKTRHSFLRSYERSIKWMLSKKLALLRSLKNARGAVDVHKYKKIIVIKKLDFSVLIAPQNDA